MESSGVALGVSSFDTRDLPPSSACLPSCDQSIFCRASRELNALDRVRVKRTYFLISAQSVQAYWRSAHPIAFWRKEFPRSERRLDADIQQFQICFFLESELAYDRSTPLPEVSGLAPGEHFAPHGRGIVFPNRSDTMRSNVIHVVPPRARDDQLLIHLHCGWCLERHCASVTGQIQSCLALLAEAGVSPQIQHL